jgi:hypothetical protein
MKCQTFCYSALIPLSLNFERHCHKTVNLLKEQNFYKLNGYTRISDKTFQMWSLSIPAAHSAHELYNEILNDKTFDD